MLNSIVGKTFALFENPSCQKIVSELENAGAQIIKFPVLEAENIDLSEDAREVLTNLVNFDWIIFPDVLTVDFFLQDLEGNAIDFFELDEIRVCACGEVVSDKLRFVQLHADVIPPRIEPKEIITALKNYIGEEEFHNRKFLLLKEVSNQNDLKNKLTDNIKISELSIYRIKIPPENEITRLKTLLKGGAIDEFIFVAPTDFIWLSHIFGGESLDQLLSDINISAVDGSIFQTAREHNLKQTVLFKPRKIDTLEK